LPRAALAAVGRVLLVLTPAIGIVTRMPDTWMFHPWAYAALGEAGVPAAWAPTLAGLFLLTATLYRVAAAVRQPARSAAVLYALYAVTLYYGDHHLQTPVFTCGGTEGGPTRPCTVLVTGGNQGIGLGVASALRAQGHRVIIGCRSAARCSAAVATMAPTRHDPSQWPQPAPVGLGALDLGQYATVAAFVGRVAEVLGDGTGDWEGGGTIDILVNNAGLTPSGNWTTAEGYEPGFGIMHLGHFALTEWLWRAQLLAPDALVVQVASDAMRMGAWTRSLQDHPRGEGDLRGEHTVGCTAEGSPLCMPPFPVPLVGPASVITGDAYTCTHGWGSYARAKLANVLYARELPRRYKGLRAVSMHPGMVLTTLAVAPARHFVPAWAAWIGAAQDLYMRILLRPPASSATVVLVAARAAADRRDMRGPYGNGMGQLLEERYMPAAAVDDETARRLWDVSLMHLQGWEEAQVAAADPGEGRI